jgi:probable F420-dependent oxidoreductase
LAARTLLAMDLGRVGLWTFQLDLQPTPAARDAAAEVEALGFGAVWLPEAAGRDPFAHASVLLGATSRVVVATGIASIYARDAMAMNAAWKTVSESFPDRFLLGLGVSHQPAVEGLRGHAYGPPLQAMREYLDRMDSSIFFAAEPSVPPQRVLAALGPKMLELAAARTSGAHPYFVPVEHTEIARTVLGSDALLCPEQMCVLETDPAEARRIARRAMATYLGLPNYTNNLRRLGYGDDDLAEGGSDRLVDAIVVWGDEAAVRDRVQAHHDAGADHVCVQVLPHDARALPLPEWRRLAPALLG